MAADLEDRIRTTDILNLSFDEELIQAFVGIVKNFQAISENVVVVLLLRNTDWVEYRPEVQTKLDGGMKRSKVETSVEIRDYQIIDPIKPQHFMDTTHLSWYEGNDIFTEFLTEEFYPLLRGN